jgi:hypothetical protein
MHAQDLGAVTVASTPPPTDEVNALINIWYPDKARTAVTAQHKGGEVGHRARVAEYWTLFPSQNTTSTSPCMGLHGQDSHHDERRQQVRLDAPIPNDYVPDMTITGLEGGRVVVGARG